MRAWTRRSPGTAITRSTASDWLSGSLRRGRPWLLLAGACAVQLAIGVAVALLSTHNHFVWYSGGDATEYWTSSWLLAHGAIPQAFVSYGVPVLWAWVPPVTGTTLIAGLPLITTLQLIVFVPLCVLLIWAIGDLLFGRRFAWCSVAIWIAAPLAMLWGFRSDYAGEFRDLFLAPHWFGLTNMADLPSLVAVLAATWATLRLLQRPTLTDGIVSGTLAGLAIGIKPANGFFIPAVVLLVAAIRSPRVLLAWCAGIAGPIATLALWKAKGRGNLPIFAYEHSREALGEHPVVGFANNYVHLDWSNFQHILHDLGEVFWSVRVLEFLAVAGLLGALRRSPLKGAFLGLWFSGFCIVKGSNSLSSIPALSYWRYVEPGLPALVFLVASVIFLIPRAGRPYEAPGTPRALPGGRRAVIAGLALFVGVPLALTAVLPAASAIRYVRDDKLANDAPLSSALAIERADAAGDAVRLAWNTNSWAPTHVYYTVYRSASPITCTIPSAGGKECVLAMTSIALTRDPAFVDHPGPGRHWYRIGLLANFRDRFDGSDLMLVGPVRSVG